MVNNSELNIEITLGLSEILNFRKIKNLQFLYETALNSIFKKAYEWSNIKILTKNDKIGVN